MKHRIIPAVVLVAGLLATETHAASPTEQLRGFFAAAGHIIESPTQGGPQERLEAIRALIRGIFDFPGAAELSLGPEWSARTSAEQAEFVRLFSGLLERTFIAGIAGRIRLADGVHVSYLGESIEGALATVRTAIASKSGLDLPFEYRMIERSGRWMVRDVMIEGVSVAANYRAQFAHVMQATSFQELIRQMRARIPETTELYAVAALDADGTAAAAVAETPRRDTPESTTPLTSHARWLLSPGRDADAPAAAAEAPRGILVAHPPTETPAAGAKRAIPEGAAAETAVLTPAIQERQREASPMEVAKAPSASDGREAGKAAAFRAARGAPGRSYWVQVGAFAHPEAARRLVSKLREGETIASPSRWVAVIEPDSAGSSLTRVRLGPFSDRAAATMKARDLEAQGYRPFIHEARD